MSSPNNNKSPSAGNVDGAGDERPRLTEEEKKQNHIASGMLFLTRTPYPLHDSFVLHVSLQGPWLIIIIIMEKNKSAVKQFAKALIA